MSASNATQNPLYLTLKSLQQSVNAIVYLAETAPDDDGPEYAIKNVLAERLKTDFDNVYLQAIQIIGSQSDVA